jgi:glycosyltransferase involved in cell wall biosynthesis
MMAQIVPQQTEANRIYVIHNWADDEAIQPISHIDNQLRSKWRLEDNFVVGYSGNLGRAHEFNTLLAAAQRLKDHPRIVFVCIGGGHGFDELRRNIVQQGLVRSFKLFPISRPQHVEVFACCD